jgi:4-amino-4-deoxy-L-arabinose transferase-like glycosyltransferase
VTTLANMPSTDPDPANDSLPSPSGDLLVPLGAPSRLSGRSLLVVLLFAAALLLPALGGRFRVLTQHEVFAAQPAREMLSGGHWVIPQFAGKPRTVKPPATGWLIAGSMALFGSEAEWVVRLPAALAGVATAGLVAWLAGRWLGDAGGLVAGLMQATFAYTLMQARLAEADMLMCAAVTLAMAAFVAGAVDAVGAPLKCRDREGAEQSGGPVLANGEAAPSTAGPAGRPLVVARSTAPLPHGRGSLDADGATLGRAAHVRTAVGPSLSAALLFHFGMGLAFLFKGVGIVFVLLGCLAWAAVTRRWRAAGRMLLHPVGLPLLAAMVVAWPLAAWRQMPDIVAVWRRETVGRATGEFDPSDPWYVYLWAVPFLLLPWLPFAVAGGVDLWRRHGRRTGAVVGGGTESAGGGARGDAIAAVNPRLVFLACWFLGGMVLLSVVSFRHKHYAIPMLPPVTLLAAAGFVGWLRQPPRPRGWRVPVTVVLAGGAIVVRGLLTFAKSARPELAMTAALVALGAAATVGLYQTGRRRGAGAACFATALAGGLAFQTLVLPRFDDYRASADLARRANAAVPAGEPIYLVALREAHVAFYLDHPLARVDRRPDIPAFVDGTARDRDAYVLCPKSAVDLLAAAGRVVELDRVDHLRRTETDPTVLVKVRATAEPVR